MIDVYGNDLLQVVYNHCCSSVSIQLVGDVWGHQKVFVTLP